MKNAWKECKQLLAGDPETLARFVNQAGPRSPLLCFVVILLGCGVYGATVGLWRDGLQSLYLGLKLPWIILITCGGNALLNGILAQVFGTGLGFRVTTYAILLSFMITALILAAFSPLSLFLLWNTPSPESSGAVTGHSITLLAHVALIAYAGIAGNHHLFRLLHHLTGNTRMAYGTLFAWLGGNLLLGSQVSWILRPFIGSPNAPVKFLCEDAMRGNFFEAVYRSILLLFN